MNRILVRIASVCPRWRIRINVTGQQIPCRYAGGVFADQGYEDPRTAWLIIFSTIEALSRRLADLESLVLGAQARERTSYPPPAGPVGPPNPPSFSPDQKPTISPYGNHGGVKHLDRVSRDESTEEDMLTPH